MKTEISLKHSDNGSESKALFSERLKLQICFEHY